MKNFFLLLLTLLVISSCSSPLYELEECETFKPGDTVYIQHFHHYGRYIVVKNMPELGIVEIKKAERNLISRSADRKIISYESFRHRRD